ncbi:MAG: S-methyl-5-thioribose-1-phosphate isomerase, partial [Dehalococcoidia bacterium]
MRIEPLKWQSGKLKLLDQTRLPLEEVYLEFTRYPQVIEAIKNMRVRGAPAIAVAAVYGLALATQSVEANSRLQFQKKMKSVSEEFAATRPTGYNLFYALKRMEAAIDKDARIEEIRASVMEEAECIAQEVAGVDRRIAQSGAELIEDGFNILTHCNAGALATAGYGTAMGMIGEAHEQGKRIGVFVDETRPLLQGARLT